MIYVIYGIVIGITNIIPGVSGGTALIFLGIFDKTMKSISNIIKLDKITTKKDDIIFITKLGLGFIIGVIGFARIIDYLFVDYFVQTIYCFIGLIVFSLPIIIKNEMKNTVFSKIYFILGLIIIGLLYYYNPSSQNNLIITDFPDITIIHSLELILLGTVAGIITIIPGISGSMFLLIVGKYYLIQSYIAESISLQPNILISIVFFGIGTLLGIIIGAKTITYLISKYKSYTMSLIIGLIVMSSIVLIPIDIHYNISISLSSLASFLFGGLIIISAEILKDKKIHVL